MDNGSINKHFKRETKIMIWVFIAPIIIAFLVAMVAPQFMSWSDIDSCLGYGGSYDYELCTCDYENNHPSKEVHQCH
ncbi:hypothetical protein KO507_15565 [Gilvimarinus agarilyticus]|uniref:hypothetical protein n=1 Tax=Gilvimarinus sp. 2_MG-2023 TaxID=3062666 RepID=UPI001C0A5914|nr:hypothetical protein [Gilvimarinus sp. 2_MG-2023]MBU2887184.1 hypothetical protein [Gilvimarinus agarilyticus]MDO6571843.1 hypothetical protein [Gilvimarinus sp. 2_MG-2023]